MPFLQEQKTVIGDANVQLAMESHLAMVRALTMQIKVLEKSILKQVEPTPNFTYLKTAPLSNFFSKCVLSA